MKIRALRDEKMDSALLLWGFGVFIKFVGSADRILLLFSSFLDSKVVGRLLSESGLVEGESNASTRFNPWFAGSFALRSSVRQGIMVPLLKMCPEILLMAPPLEKKVKLSSGVNPRADSLCSNNEYKTCSYDRSR